jgi:hypothetical protein
MLFLFPKKKIVLDCFTSENYVIEYAPINFAIKHIPEWWKNLPVPHEHEPIVNMRNCVGMIEYYKRSIAIPIWSDLLIQIEDDKSYRWQFSDLKSVARVHPEPQMSNFLSTHGHLKIESPWRLASEKGLNWVWSHPTYNYPFSSDIACLPGITDFYYQHSVNVNMMLLTENKKKILIKQGQPIALLTPMSDRKIKIVRHLVDEKEIRRIDNKINPISFLSKYKSIIKRKEQFKNCPYQKDTNVTKL